MPGSIFRLAGAGLLRCGGECERRHASNYDKCDQDAFHSPGTPFSMAILFFRSSIAAPQITSLRATLLPSFASRHTSCRAACASRLTTLRTSLHRGNSSWRRRERRLGRRGLGNLGLSFSIRYRGPRGGRCHACCASIRYRQQRGGRCRACCACQSEQEKHPSTRDHFSHIKPPKVLPRPSD